MSQSRVILCLRKCANGKVELSCYDPKGGREVRSGIMAWPGTDLDTRVHQVKTQLERAGNFVEVKEM